MTIFDLCTKLGKVLPKGILLSLRYAGLLRTSRHGNQDVYVNVHDTHVSLTTTLERVKRESTKTIQRVQAGLNLLENNET